MTAYEINRRIERRIKLAGFISLATFIAFLFICR